ncbi:MAG: peptide chain release factor 2 [Clostridia bacterium]|nr:peptide chain release factor 2 [Clostridia bacterium]
MVEYEQIRLDLAAMETPIGDLETALDITGTVESIKNLEKETLDPDFYNDIKNSQKVLQKIKELNIKVTNFNSLKTDWEDLSTLVDLAIAEDDESVLEEIQSGFEALSEKIENMKLETLLSGPYDKSNAIITLHAGAGGTEAQDWCQMLFRMYQMWGERRGYKVSTLDILDGDEAGLKGGTLLIEGLNAYGFAKSEKGIHRLVRISPFDAAGRRHTSFASVEVMPDLDDEIEININPDDLRIDTYRASGAGGQHVNKTSSAIRITHIPTGVVVACQNERSQFQNKDTAMKMLKAKLMELAEAEQKEKIEDIKGVQKEIAWGSQIRSYVFHPYTMVKDHRTNFEVGNIGSVMDGNLDGFINDYLKKASLGQLNLK